MLGPVAYALSFGTALACALLLTRAHRQNGYRLLFWSALCFWGLTTAHAIAVLDDYMLPHHDLYLARLAAHGLSISVLLYGLVWESR